MFYVYHNELTLCTFTSHVDVMTAYVQGRIYTTCSLSIYVMR